MATKSRVPVRLENRQRRRLGSPQPNASELPSDVFQRQLKVQGLFEWEVQWHILSQCQALHLRLNRKCVE